MWTFLSSRNPQLHAIFDSGGRRILWLDYITIAAQLGGYIRSDEPGVGLGEKIESWAVITDKGPPA